MLPIATLIATKPRLDMLTQHGLPSIAAQRLKPRVIVVVSDERPFSAEEKNNLRSLTPSVEILFKQNQHAPGAAGTWNTGFSVLNELYQDCYVAVIDDDDHWHANHLASCESNSDNGTADIVLSGINVVQGNSVIARNIPDNISIGSFLTGNPGWQGSNTFIKLSTAMRVGGYTNGLISCNDRDFAIRALQLDDIDIRYTRQVTVD